jgi:PiT family inorganic phosphate transporter
MNYLAIVTGLSSQALAHPVQPGPLSYAAIALLCLAVGLALAFEFVNGFHDTANAVATVIYTHSLPPWVAVIWSGFWNLVGVMASTGGVAFGVLALLPSDMVLNAGSSAAFAMVFAILLSAIIWNLGTWYLGLPASSSHSLFGAIIGVGLANALMSSGHHLGNGVNWPKLGETLMALLISPVIGFVLSGLLLLLSKAMLKWPALYKAPEGNKAPPKSIRALLILTCTGVSLGHGSNDGSKGMGLILLILIGILPGTYALNARTDAVNLHDKASLVQAALLSDRHAALPAGTDSSTVLSAYLKNNGTYSQQILASLADSNGQIVKALASVRQISELSTEQRSQLRKNIYLTSGTLAKMQSQKKITDPNLTSLLGDGSKKSPGYLGAMKDATQFIPFWVQLATALALGLGTMIGWKRIVVTVGEKIGKTHLTYGQGAAAEMVAAGTILIADHFHLPVSTTHVLSSGVAGTMAANKSGLQTATLRNLLLAWVLTLPVCVLLGAGLFAGGLLIILNNLGPVVIGLVLIAVLLFVGRTLKFPRAGRRAVKGSALPAV